MVFDSAGETFECEWNSSLSQSLEIQLEWISGVDVYFCSIENSGIETMNDHLRHMHSAHWNRFSRASRFEFLLSQSSDIWIQKAIPNCSHALNKQTTKYHSIDWGESLIALNEVDDLFKLNYLPVETGNDTHDSHNQLGFVISLMACLRRLRKAKVQTWVK